MTVLAGGAQAPGPERTAPSEASDLRVHFLGASEIFAAPGALARLRQNPARSLSLFAAVPRLVRVLRDLEPVDAVVMHWLLPCAFPGLLVLRASGVDLSRTALECILHGSDARLLAASPRALRTRVLRSLRARHVTLTFVSRALREALSVSVAHDPSLERWVAASRVAPAPLGTLPALDRTAAREALHLDRGARLFVVVGRLVSRKRVATALAALACVPDAHVVVLGEGPERTALEKHHPEVRFLGSLPRDQALRWMAAADCLISASRDEGAPTVVREARALGTSVVTSDAGDVALWAERDPGLFVVS